MLLATMRANSPAMTIATPQATFLTPASSLDVQVRVSSSSGGMVGIVARSDALHRPPYRGVGVTPSSRETAAATLDFRLWPFADIDRCPFFGRYWGAERTYGRYRRNDVNDPSATFAVQTFRTATE